MTRPQLRGGFVRVAVSGVHGVMLREIPYPRGMNSGKRGSAAAMWALAWLGMTGVVLLLMWRSQGRTPDDAFIFFRYARNIAEGDGWAYNVGDAASNGATSPLWALLLAVVYLLPGSMEAGAWALYAACLAGAGVLTFAALRQAGQTSAGVVSALLIVTTPALVWIRGMESALFLLLAAAVLLVGLGAARDAGLGVLGGLLVLVRPEGAILLAIIVGLRVWKSRRIPWITAVAAAVTVAPWVAYSTWRFGTPIAGTLAAKTAQGASGYFGPSFVFARYIRTMLSNPWSTAYIVLALVGLVAGVRQRRTRELVAVTAGFGAVHFLLYATVVRPPAYLWYYAPTYWVGAVLTGVGVAWLGSLFGAALTRLFEGATAEVARRWSIAAVSVVTLGLVALNLHGQSRGDIYRGYAEAAEWLKANSPEDASVSATEIGVLGWVSERPIVDYLGLLEPLSAEEVGRGDLSTWIGREQPDYYVQHLPVWDMEAPSASVDWFARAYRPVFESDADGWSRVRVFERVRTREQAVTADDPVVLTPTVLDAFASAGVRLDQPEREALAELLAVYVGDFDLQEQFETDDGADLKGLLGSAGSVSGVSPRQAELLEQVADRLGDRQLLSPLA